MRKKQVVVEIIVAMLWSVSPFGEAKVGIPYAIFNDVNVYFAFAFCFVANVCVFPIMHFFLRYLNQALLGWRFYKKNALKVAQRIKKGAGSNVRKYGFWGILIFVMLPVPGTGVYAGTIAAYLFQMSYNKAFWANTIGIFLSCVFVWAMTMATYHSMN